MKTIAVIGQKGGTGKTMTAIGLAVAAYHAGKLSVVIDLDPQASAANWKDRRTEEHPAVVSAQASRLKQTLDAARELGAEIAIVDTAGRKDDSSLLAARLADLVLIPTMPCMADLETLPSASDILRLAGSPPAFVVLTRLHPAATRQAHEARDIIARQFGLSVAPVHLSYRSAYIEAFNAGGSPQELDAGDKAAAELDRLCQFVLEIVNK